MANFVSDYKLNILIYYHYTAFMVFGTPFFLLPLINHNPFHKILGLTVVILGNK